MLIDGVIEDFCQCLKSAIDHGEIQVFLTLKVTVECNLGNTSLFGYTVHLGIAIPSASDDLNRRIDNIILFDLSLR